MLLNKKNALIIFMKAPLPGTVKTRLQPQLTPEQSQELYMAMGKDLVRQFYGSDKYDLLVHFWPPEGKSLMQNWLGNNLIYREQISGNLGEKMHFSFARMFEAGYQRVAIIGSDLPTLMDSRIIETFHKLANHDVVIGPTDDGGYYLIGLKSLQPEVFENVVWSTELVLPKTLENARRANLTVFQLTQEADLDTYQQVRQLWQSIIESGTAIKKENIPNTGVVLKAIFSNRQG